MCPRACSNQDEPLGHASQGSWDRLFLAAALPAGCCPLCLTHTGSQVPWGGRAAGERLSFTLTQLLQEAFLSLVLAFILDRSFSSGGGGRGVGEGLTWSPALPLTLEFFNRHDLRRFGPELERFGGLGSTGSSGRAHSLER